jgi:hypothetical protein
MKMSLIIAWIRIFEVKKKDSISQLGKYSVIIEATNSFA